MIFFAVKFPTDHKGGGLTAGRRVGMADEADSKSVVGNHVWVQVPLPAVYKKESIPGGVDSFLYNREISQNFPVI